MNKDEIIDLIENGSESDYLDFKLDEYKNYNYHEFLKDLMAFANSHSTQTKYIIIGMKKKDGVITFKDMPSITDDANYQEIANEYLEPTIDFKYVPFQYENNHLGIFIINSNNLVNRFFSFKKDYKRGTTVMYKKGEMRIRKGSSTSLVSKFDMQKAFGENERKSNLTIKGFKEGKIIEGFTVYNFDDLYLTSIEEKEKEIKNLITQISNIEIVDEEPLEESKGSQSELSTKLSELTSSFGKSMNFLNEGKFIEDVKIKKDVEDVIKIFCDKKEYKINNDFFDVGKLKLYEKVVFSGGMYMDRFLKGTEQEKQKYELINKLHQKIVNFVNTFNYINDIKGISYLKLLIENNGDWEDENIIISLYFPKNVLCDKKNLICNNKYGSSFFNELYQKFLEMIATSEIDVYTKSVLNGVAPTTNYSRLMNLNSFGYARQSNTDDMEPIWNAESNIEEIYCYENLSDGNYDILRFETNKLLHNCKCFFPGVIVLNKVPEEIRFEIKSKHMKDLKTGVIKLQKGKE